jgi:hypothetical protein
MACEKYAGWMTEAALGELHPGREAELLLHAGDCDACREAYNQAKAVARAVDRSVESLVAGEPSEQCAGRLRARISDEPGPVRWIWAGGTVLAPKSRRLFAVAAGTLALATLLLSVLARLPEHNNPAPTVALSSGASPETLLPQAPPQPRSMNPPQLRAVSQVRPFVLARSSEPEVLVRPGQLEATMQFAEAIRTGRVNGAQVLAAEQVLDKLLETEPSELPQGDTPQDDDSANALRSSGVR